MTALTIFGYLFGSAKAIRLVAAHPLTLPVGLLLVVSAGLARNYDQMLLTSSANWFLGPIFASCVSWIGIGIFMMVAWDRVRVGSSDQPLSWPWRLRSCLGLFWMSAPVAWLYAIPVERWCSPVEAAHWNIRILSVVVVWRVLLLARVQAVLSGDTFRLALGRVLAPASLEALAVSGSTTFSAALMRGMGGLRNSPAEDVLLGALNTSFVVLYVGLAVGLLLLRFCRKPLEPMDPIQPPPWRRVPVFFLASIAAVALWAVQKPQAEWRLTAQARQLEAAEDWKGLAAFLSRHARKDFAPAAVLPPSPWELGSAQNVPIMFAALGPDTAPWVREQTVESLEVLLSQGERALRWCDTDWSVLLRALQDQKEGPGIVKRHPEAVELIRQLDNKRAGESAKKAEETWFPRRTEAPR